MSISDLSKSDMTQLFEIFQKSVKDLKSSEKTPVPKGKWKVEGDEAESGKTPWYDMGEDKESPNPVAEREDDGLLSFSEMSLDKTRTAAFRQSPLWRKSCAKWTSYLKGMGQPVLIWWSNRGDPLKNTCYVREVKGEKVEATKVGSKRQESISEKTYSYKNTYGIEIPPEDFRLRAKERMNKIFDIDPSDSEEFKQWRKKIDVVSNEESIAVPSEPRTQIGTIYEQQLEYHFNMAGYHVNLHGIKKKREDEGVDHILVKNGKTTLVQAKAYSSNSSISPADIDMIYGNMTSFYTKHANNESLVIGSLDKVLLVVPSEDTLSRTSKTHAETVGLKIEVVPIKADWPKYKCIVSAKNKIFYGPGDSHYSKVEMLSDKRRFWADSLEEAYGKNYKKPGQNN